MKKACLIYDVDGVLFDVDSSFHTTIIKSIHLYTHLFWGINTSDWIDTSIVHILKKKGGFNDDWELTASILCLLSSLIDPQKVQNFIKNKKKVSTLDPDIIINLFQLSIFKEHIPSEEEKEKFLKLLHQVPVNKGITYFYQKKDTPFQNSIIFFKPQDNADEISPTNLIKRIFQEIYLGSLFFNFYNKKRIFYHGQGLCQKEKPLISKKLLQKLSQTFILCIATGRDRQDLYRSLDEYQLTTFFKHMITTSDLQINEKKPHPKSLQIIQKLLKETSIHYWFYIGDQIDDMIMATQMKSECHSLKSIAFVNPDDPKIEVFKKMNIDFITNNHEQIESWTHEQIKG